MRVAVIIPALNKQARIVATVRAASSIPGADLVLVVDDGSSDATAAVAHDAGAVVIQHARNRGKGAAMESGAMAIEQFERRESDWTPRVLLFLDGDLEDTAALAGPLAEPVRDGTADMTIATLPTQ